MNTKRSKASEARLQPLLDNLEERAPKKRKNVPVRPTPEQLELLHRRKAGFGYKSLSKYLIERGLCEGEMITIVDRRKIDRLLFEVRKVGVNINQIARRLNEAKRGYSQETIDRAAALATAILSEISGAIKR